MRISFSVFAAVSAACFFSIGCAGPENKLGRGLLNVTELTRLGEVRRSMEQTALWDGTDMAYTTGFFRGLNRSLVRTAIGAFEVATFPIPTPTYDPLLTPKGPLYPDISIRTYSYPWGGLALPEHPVYPDSYKPGLLEDSTFATDTSIGFSGGDVGPMLPGSRFRIFED
jgi:putative exosortase-associated protein (TIGR04073 family)